jgi:hypothetical protein
MEITPPLFDVAQRKDAKDCTKYQEHNDSATAKKRRAWWLCRYGTEIVLN